MDFMNRPNAYTGLGGLEIPEMVTYSGTTGSEVILGEGTQGPVTVDLDAESPHILVNAPTGKGKSTIARSIAVQSRCCAMDSSSIRR